MPGRILVIEDEEAIAAFVQTALERDGFTVKWIDNGVDALGAVVSFQPDLIILDLTLPGLDGLQICQAVRQRQTYLPIIMLTARAEDTDKIVGLEVGADDYVTKPFNARELLARVRAILRLARRTDGCRSPNRLCFGQLEIDLEGRQVFKAGRAVDLAPKEFDLLVALARAPGRVFGRDTLLELVWGYDFNGDSRTVDVHMQRLRRKLEQDPHQPRYLLTVHSIGYKFAANAQE
jgi:two-component system response regulator MtrA